MTALLDKQNIYDQIKNNPNYNIKQSWQWFNTQVRQVATAAGVKPMDVMSDNQDRMVQKIMPGSMYMYFYDPIHKDTLPYYDTFPLLIPFSMHGRYFTGLNLHYLSPKVRLKLFDRLLNYVTDDKLSDTTKMMLQWKFLKNVSKFPEVAPCVKMYEKGHVKSKFLKVRPDEWIITLFLPTEKFKKADNRTVWKNSSSLI